MGSIPIISTVQLLLYVFIATSNY